MTRLYIYASFPESPTQTYVQPSPGYADVYQVDPITGNIQLGPNISPINPQFTYNYTGYANSLGGTYQTNYIGSLNSPTFVSATPNLEGPQTLSQISGSQLSTILICYLSGTRIATADGEAAIESLRVGDLVRTAGETLRPIRWIGRGHVRQNWIESLDPQRVPVRIRAGALGADKAGPLPRRDLLVTHNHGMVVNGALIPAAWLRNGTSITSEIGKTTWEYHHIELESHDILLAEGAASESYRQCGNRFIFDNAFERDAGTEELPCLPIVLEGPLLERARQMIIARSAACPLAFQPTISPQRDLSVTGS